MLTRLTLRADLAEDLLQELFVRLGRSRAFARAADPAAYASRAAIHLACDWHRRRRRGPAVEALTAEPAADGPSPLAELVRREELEQVVRALSALPAGSRECVVLHYLQQEPYEAVAAQLGKTSHQVRALCHKGIVRLRRLVPSRPPANTAEEATRDEA